MHKLAFEEKDYLINFAGLTKRDGSFIVSRSKKKFNIKDLVGKHIIAGREGILIKSYKNKIFLNTIISVYTI